MGAGAGSGSPCCGLKKATSGSVGTSPGNATVRPSDEPGVAATTAAGGGAGAGVTPSCARAGSASREAARSGFTPRHLSDARRKNGDCPRFSGSALRQWAVQLGAAVAEEPERGAVAADLGEIER